MKQIYLDYAAATPMDKRVIGAMEPYFTNLFYNPSASYLAGRAAKKDLNEARTKIAHWLGARPGEIIFTAGATEANNLAISGIMEQFPEGEVLVSSIEHDSVLAPSARYRCRQIPVTKQGIVDLQALQKMLTPKTVLVSVMLVNNELGSIQPLREIRKILDESSNSRKGSLPLYLHTDAAQAANLLDLHVARLGVDLMSLNGGKIYGPKQSGILYCRASIELRPLIVGGGQENGRRSGTENLPAAVGLATALEIAQNQRQSESKRLADLRRFFILELGKQIPDAILNGSDKHQSPHLVSVTFPGQDNERLMMTLDEVGIQVAVGSACSASSQEPSHVLRAIGLKKGAVQASLRFSFGRHTTQKQLQQTVASLSSALRANR